MTSGLETISVIIGIVAGVVAILGGLARLFAGGRSAVRSGLRSGDDPVATMRAIQKQRAGKPGSAATATVAAAGALGGVALGAHLVAKAAKGTSDTAGHASDHGDIFGHISDALDHGSDLL